MYFIVGGPLNGKFVTRDVPRFLHAVLEPIAAAVNPVPVESTEIEKVEYIQTQVYLGRQVLKVYRAAYIHPDTAANFFFEEVAKVWNKHVMGKMPHRVG